MWLCPIKDIIGTQDRASNNVPTTNDDRSFCPACSIIYVSYSRIHSRHVYSVIEKLVLGLDFFLEMSCVPPDATWNNFTRSRARNLYLRSIIPLRQVSPRDNACFIVQPSNRGNCVNFLQLC